jgi:hypothetical protein
MRAYSTNKRCGASTSTGTGTSTGTNRTPKAGLFS